MASCEGTARAAGGEEEVAALVEAHVAMAAEAVAGVTGWVVAAVERLAMVATGVATVV